MTNRLRLVLALAAACLAAGWASTATEERASRQTGGVHPGRADYVEMGCYQCHGYEGQGARGTGPRLAPNPLDYDAFSMWVRQPPQVMPAYSPKILDEEKLERIHAYLASIPPPPDPSTIPLLSEE